MNEAIPVQTKRYEPRTAECAHCGTAYLKCAPNHRFCTDICRRTSLYGVRQCAWCGDDFVPRARRDGVTEHCSQFCYIDTQQQEAECFAAPQRQGAESVG